MKITKIIVAVALVTAILTACGDDVDITIHKVTSDFVPDTDITVVSKGDYVPPESTDTSSKSTTSKTSSESKEELPVRVKTVARTAANKYFPDYSSFSFYNEGIATIGGYECYVVEVFSESIFLATYAVGVDYDYVAFAYDTTNEKYRIMNVSGDSVSLAGYADTLVSHGTYTNQPAGYTFEYDGEPDIRTKDNVTVFTTPLWGVAIEGEVPTATLDFSKKSIREAQEESVMRDMIEDLGLVFDWAQDSRTVTIGGGSFVERSFFATYGDSEIEHGTVFYGYASNGMFYKIVAFSLGEGDSAAQALNGINFVPRVVGGTVRDQRTKAKQPTWPTPDTPDYSETVSKYDRPFGW